MTVACSRDGYHCDEPEEYLIVNKQMLEDRVRLIRSDRDMLRAILDDTLKHVHDLRTIARAKRALAITEPNRRPVRFP